jgi:hypothetical protein
MPFQGIDVGFKSHHEYDFAISQLKEKLKMAKQKMSVTRAMVLLKNKNETLEQLLGYSSKVAMGAVVEKGSKNVNLNGQVLTREDFAKEAQSFKDKLTQAFTSVQSIRKAIQKSNHETMVSIGGVEMSVADVLSYKQSVLGHKKSLLSRLQAFSAQLSQVFAQSTTAYQQMVEKQTAEFMKANSANSNKDTFEEKLKSVKALVSDREPELVDPLKVIDWTNALAKEIQDFETEVDFVLQESNARTEIEVDV